MKARSPRAALAALARSTSAGSLAGGSPPGHSTPRSAAGSVPAPRTNSGKDRSAAPRDGGAACRVRPGIVVIAAPVAATYRLSDDTIVARAGRPDAGRSG